MARSLARQSERERVCFGEWVRAGFLGLSCRRSVECSRCDEMIDSKKKSRL